MLKEVTGLKNTKYQQTRKHQLKNAFPSSRFCLIKQTAEEPSVIGWAGSGDIGRNITLGFFTERWTLKI